MITTMLAFVLLARGGIEIGLAPDQPVPHVYTDDPLIIEFRSDQDVVAQVALEIKPDFPASTVKGEPFEVALRAQGTHWHAISNAPVERGRYWVVAHINVGGQVSERSVPFCRFDRPGTGEALPVCVQLSVPSLPALHAVRDASLQRICLDAASPALSEQVNAAATLGLQTGLMLNTSQAEVCENLAKTLGDRIVRWNLGVGGDSASIATQAKALKSGGTKAPAFVVVPDAPTLTGLLSAGMGQYIGGVVLSGGETNASAIETLRNAAEHAGYEGFAICTSIHSGEKTDPAQGAHFCRQYLEALSVGANEVQIDGMFVYTNEIGAGYPYLNALARRLPDAEYIGRLPFPATVHNVIFRTGPGWTMALWRVQEAAGNGSKDIAQEIAIKLDSVTNLALYDARNNPISVPPLKDGQIVVTVGPEPIWITGVGGNVIADAARNGVRQAASAFVTTDEFKSRLSPDAIDLVKKFASAEAAGYTRLDFLNLLKMLPKIEELWHGETFPRSMAVPAEAQLARLARMLCVVEQERGEAFVEPLQSTLGNSGQLQSSYLTSSSGASEGHERADWIYNEVARLMAEAEKLNTDGRSIEACGVAALAEWRARSLEFAKKAQPLSAPEKIIPPPPVAEVKNTSPDKTASEDKDKKDPASSKKTARKRRTK